MIIIRTGIRDVQNLEKDEDDMLAMVSFDSVGTIALRNVSNSDGVDISSAP